MGNWGDWETDPKKMREILVSSKETKECQIKSDNQLSDLTDSVQLISDKFDEHDKDRKN